eukprot:6361870-Alexandrium_andersonii.AAC.1
MEGALAPHSRAAGHPPRALLGRSRPWRKNRSRRLERSRAPSDDVSALTGVTGGAEPEAIQPATLVQEQLAMEE